MTEHTRIKIGAIAVVFALLLAAVAAFAGVGAATWSANSPVDGTTAEKTYTFGSDNTATVTVYANSTTVASTTDIELRLEERGTNETLAVLSNTTVTEPNVGEFKIVATVEDTGDIPRSSGETVGELAVYDAANSSQIADSADVKFDYGASSPGGSDTVLVATDDEYTSASYVASSTENETVEPAFYAFWGESFDRTTAEFSGVPVNGSNSDIVVQLNGAHATAMADQTGEHEDGQIVPAVIMVDDKPTVAFYGSAPDYAPDRHAVYNADTDEFTIVTGDEMDGETTADVEIRTAQGHSFWTLSDQIGLWPATKHAVAP